jgi:hypothetical protein
MRESYRVNRSDETPSGDKTSVGSITYAESNPGTIPVDDSLTPKEGAGALNHGWLSPKGKTLGPLRP